MLARQEFDDVTRVAPHPDISPDSRRSVPAKLLHLETACDAGIGFAIACCCLVKMLADGC